MLLNNKANVKTQMNASHGGKDSSYSFFDMFKENELNKHKLDFSLLKHDSTQKTDESLKEKLSSKRTTHHVKLTDHSGSGNKNPSRNSNSNADKKVAKKIAKLIAAAAVTKKFINYRLKRRRGEKKSEKVKTKKRACFFKKQT